MSDNNPTVKSYNILLIAFMLTLLAAAALFVNFPTARRWKYPINEMPAQVPDTLNQLVRVD